MTVDNVEIRCRAAEPGDASSIGRVVVAAWRHGYPELMPSTFLDGLDPMSVQARWEKELTSTREFRRVVTVHGEVVGACSGGPLREGEPLPKTGELYSINVHPDCWGQGVGAALLLDAESAMIEHGFSGAILWVLSGNARAQRFYSARGWRATGEERSTRHLIGAPLHELCFRATF